MKHLIASIVVTKESDILLARQQARQIAALLRFEIQDQSRIGTATSEIARDILAHAQGGEIHFLYLYGPQNPVFEIAVTAIDRDSFIRMVRALNGESLLRSDAGTGLLNARRLLDQFVFLTESQGSPRAIFGKIIGHQFPVSELENVSQQIKMMPLNGYAESEHLTKELLSTIELLKKRQEELGRLNQELEETNRGVVALYAELDEKAKQLRTADQLKSRFLSHVSHEFRTPLNSIVGMSRLLLNHTDGDLNQEQGKQVKFILQAAQGLTEMVNDLLDLAKIEAGKTDVLVNEFHVSDLFGALRGMFRPIATNPHVRLVFVEPHALPVLRTDEAKVSQILRNYVSNALKFTERGEIRVEATLDQRNVIFSVKDSGIGITLEDQDLLFREFSQLNSALQKRTKGTGLGLALCRKLADLLGGSVSVTSEPGKGSVFSARIPVVYGSHYSDVRDDRVPDVALSKVLIVDDDEASRYLIRGWFANTHFSVIEASNAVEGIELALRELPEVIILDLNMPGMDGFEFLKNMRSNPLIADIPVVVNTAKILDETEEAFLQEFAPEVLSKAENSREEALAMIQSALSRREVPK